MNVPPGFFSSVPVVDVATGNLSFELAPGATGSAELSFMVEDDGGTDNGGNNQSNAVTVTIEESEVVFEDGFET